MTYFRGGPRFVTVCDRGGGSKIIKNSVTYFMDGPYYAICINGIGNILWHVDDVKSLHRHSNAAHGFAGTLTRCLETNAQSAGLRSLVAAESALQQPKQQMRNAVSKGPPLTYFRFAGDIIYYVFIFRLLVESHLIRNTLV